MGSVVREIRRVRHFPGPMAKSMVLEPGHWEDHDPFLLMAEDWFAAPYGFPSQPQRGFEAVSLILEGHLAHKNSCGKKGILGPGDVQLMTAARGLIHSEMPLRGRVHMLKLWINLPASAKGAQPQSHDLAAKSIPIRREPGIVIRVIVGSSGEVEAKTKTQVPVTVLEIRAGADRDFVQRIGAGHNGFVYIMSGRARFGDDQTPAGAGEVLWLRRDPERASQFWVRTDEDLHCVLCEGPPLKEPVAAHGPFVMNTEAEVQQAFMDFRKGELV